MKKGLIGAILASLVLVFASGAMATDVDFTQSGTIEFKISGSTADDCSGLFAAGDVLLNLNFVATCGSWELNISPEFDLDGGEVGVGDAYITYHGSMFDFSMYPTGTDMELYDIAGSSYGGDPVVTPSNPGIKVAFPLEMATLTFMVNNQCDQVAYCTTVFDCYCDCYTYWYDDECWCDTWCETAWTDGDSIIFNFGGEIEFALDPMTFGIMFITNADPTHDWYGNAFGAKAAFNMDPLTFIVEYGSWTPDTTTRYYCEGSPCWEGCELCDYDPDMVSGTGYYFELDYDGGDMGSFVFSYTGADQGLNTGGWDYGDPFSKLYFEYSYPLAECVNLVLDVTNTNDGMGGDAVTGYGGKLSCSF